MRKLKGSFVAKDDDGQEYVIEIYEDAIDIKSHSNPTATIKGLKTLQTTDGLGVNRISKGQYKLGDLLLYSDSPDAP